MRRWIVAGLLLLLGLGNCALATDYELTVDPSAKDLLKSGAITLYEPYGLIKKGDRIVNLLLAPLPKPNIGCRVIIGSDKNSVDFLTKNTVQGYHGEIRLGTGSSDSRGYAGALLMHVVTPRATKSQEGALGAAQTFVEQRPWIWILTGLVGLGMLLIAFLRFKDNNSASPPVYGKRAYEENIRDIKGRLERILESQELLVKKPPVLRTFRKQIDRFEHRLQNLEITAVTTQQALSVLAQTAVQIEQLAAKIDSQTLDIREDMVTVQGSVAKAAHDLKSVERSLKADITSNVNSLNTAIQEARSQQAERLAEMGASQEKLIGSIALNLEEAARSTALDLQHQLEVATANFDQKVETFSRDSSNLASQLGHLSVLHGQESKERESGLSKVYEAVQASVVEQSAFELRFDATVEKILEWQKSHEERLNTLMSEGASKSDVAALTVVSEEIATILQQLESLRSTTQDHAQALEAQRKDIGPLIRSADHINEVVSEIESHLGEQKDQIGSSHQLLQQMQTELSEGTLAHELRELASSAHLKIEALSSGLTELKQASESLITGALKESHLAELSTTIDQKLNVLESLVRISGGGHSDKQGKGASEQSLKAFADALQKLADESEERHKLDELLRQTRASLETVPELLHTLQERLDSAASSDLPVVVDFSPLESLLTRLSEQVQVVPTSLTSFQSALQSISSQCGTTTDKVALAIELLASLGYEQEKLFGLVATSVQHAPTLDYLTSEATTSLSAPAERAPISTVNVETHLQHTMADGTSESVREETEQLVQELVQSESTVLEVSPTIPLSLSKAPTMGSWDGSGASALGTWACNVGTDLQENDSESACRPLTPTETPGIEYPIGGLLYVRKRVIYAHGDTLRAFWPGKNERSLMLSHQIPADSWRLLRIQDALFCAQEKRVEIVDLANWSRQSGFSGEFWAHTSLGGSWAGLRTGKSPSLELRDLSGELLGKPIELPEPVCDRSVLVAAGTNLYVTGANGELFVLSKGRLNSLGNLSSSEGRIYHLCGYQEGLVALVVGADGASVQVVDNRGERKKEVRTDTRSICGNPVLLGHYLYFFDADRFELVSCDLKRMALIDSVPLPSTQKIRRMTGLSALNREALLVAGSDAGGQLGSVFLLDPRTGKHTVLCSTNQPLVDIIFAGAHPVVATSSSYQNIIRIFEPFKEEPPKVERAA